MTHIDRRTVLTLLAAGALPLKADYKLQFFTDEENRALDCAAEMILPADEHSPGAHEARVSYYIDLVVANSPAETQSRWRAGLRELGDSFAGSPEARRKTVLDSIARTPFFADLRKHTLTGYYTSKIGLIQELGYQGNQAMSHFPGCPHPPGTHK